MHEQEIVGEIVAVMRHHMEKYTRREPPKVTLKIPKTFITDVSVLAKLFEQAKQLTPFSNAVLCVDSCASAVFCQGCGRGYRGPFVFDLCHRCSGPHFEPDNHLQVCIEANDRRAPHKRQKGEWRVTVPQS